MLASATTEMSKQNSNLSGKLAQSSQEMEKLRASLRQARAEALTDALTGIANRKLFDETLRLRKEEADSEKTELSLLLCDIDHFKTFNDRYGHEVGDQALRMVAGRLAQVGGGGRVFRHGGEEFAMLLLHRNCVLRSTRRALRPQVSGLEPRLVPAAILPLVPHGEAVAQLVGEAARPSGGSGSEQSLAAQARGTIQVGRSAGGEAIRILREGFQLSPLRPTQGPAAGPIVIGVTELSNRRTVR